MQPALMHVQVPSRDRPSTVIAFAQKTFKDGNLTSKLHVIELGAPAGATMAHSLLTCPDTKHQMPLAIVL